MDVKMMNPITLAYMGDAVYESFIRDRIVRAGRGGGHADLLHKAGVRYVNAAAQARALDAMIESLTEEEQGVVRRARNHKIATKPRNAAAVTYKKATAFEALIGYLWLSDNKDRCSEIMLRAAELTEVEK